jgi:DNA-binding CsgD family transcriptional regulator
MKRKDDSPAEKTTGVSGTSRRAAPVGAALLTDLAWSEVGRSLKLIAGNLGVSEHTIHTHLHRLFSKLRVTTRTQMVVRVMQELLMLTLSDTGSLPPICRHRVNGRCPMEN